MNSTVDAGQLREIIYIQEKSGDMDELGFCKETFKTLYRLRSQKKTVSLKVSEGLKANRESSTQYLKFICRKRKGITNKMFILYNNVRYNITNVYDLDDFFLELTAETPC